MAEKTRGWKFMIIVYCQFSTFYFQISSRRSIRINRDLKGFTTRKIMKTVQDNPQDPSLKVQIGEAKSTQMDVMDV